MARCSTPALVLILTLGLIPWASTSQQYGKLMVNTDTNATLQCPFALPDIIWLLPDGTGVDGTPSEDLNYRFQVDSENGTLTINPLVDEDNGYYTCLVRQTKKPTANRNVWTSYQIRLIVIPHVFDGDLWNHYEQQFIIGFIASGTVIAFVLFLFFLDKFRWKPPKEDKMALRTSNPEDI